LLLSVGVEGDGRRYAGGKTSIRKVLGIICPFEMSVLNTSCLRMLLSGLKWLEQEGLMEQSSHYAVQMAIVSK